MQVKKRNVNESKKQRKEEKGADRRSCEVSAGEIQSVFLTPLYFPETGDDV